MSPLKLLALLLLSAPAFAGEPKLAMLEVSGMTCSLCPLTVRKALERVPGVLQAKADLDTQRAEAKYDPDKVSPEALAKARHAGIRARRPCRRMLACSSGTARDAACASSPSREIAASSAATAACPARRTRPHAAAALSSCDAATRMAGAGFAVRGVDQLFEDAAIGHPVTARTLRA